MMIVCMMITMMIMTTTMMMVKISTRAVTYSVRSVAIARIILMAMSTVMKVDFYLYIHISAGICEHLMV